MAAAGGDALPEAVVYDHLQLAQLALFKNLLASSKGDWSPAAVPYTLIKTCQGFEDFAAKKVGSLGDAGRAFALKTLECGSYGEAPHSNEIVCVYRPLDIASPCLVFRNYKVLHEALVAGSFHGIPELVSRRCLH